MADKCKSCIVGMIGSGPIKEGYWQQALSEFEKVIDDWNEKTNRFEVPHPGFARKFCYCPHCGHKVED